MRKSLVLALVASFFFPLRGRAVEPPDPGLLTLDRIFSPEFGGEHFGQVHWLKDGAAYTKLEASARVRSASDLVAYDPATNKRTVVVAADRLKPNPQAPPLYPEDFTWSKDGGKLLIFTNSQRVWRQHTRGDYWLYDLKAGKLTKLGGDAPPSSLM